jgi:hypothetical protein
MDKVSAPQSESTLTKLVLDKLGYIVGPNRSCSQLVKGLRADVKLTFALKEIGHDGKGQDASIEACHADC